MNKADVLSKLQEIFDDIFLEPVEVIETLSAKDVPEWDSLRQVSLVLGVEKAFGIRFRVGEVEGVKDVGQFAELILERIDKP